MEDGSACLNALIQSILYASYGRLKVTFNLYTTSGYSTKATFTGSAIMMGVRPSLSIISEPNGIITRYLSTPPHLRPPKSYVEPPFVLEKYVPPQDQVRGAMLVP